MIMNTRSARRSKRLISPAFAALIIAFPFSGSRAQSVTGDVAAHKNFRLAIPRRRGKVPVPREGF
jgi:hypothetical protein